LKKSAFTLAEVLTTLTIVGVIMSLVVPVVKNTVVDTNGLQYKKAITDFQNAVDMAAEDPNSHSLGYSLDTNFVGVTPQNLCEMIADKFTTVGTINCSVDSSDYTVDSPSFQQINGVSYWNVGGVGTSAFLDGTTDCTTSSYSKNCVRTIWVDINGRGKGKNVHGKDVYRMLLRYDGKVILGNPTSDNWNIEEKAIKESYF